MSVIPIQTIVIIVAGIVATIYFLVSRRRRIDTQDKEYSQYRAGELAQRLGLSLEEGDPNFNFFIAQTDKSVNRGPKDTKPVDVSVRMIGERNNVPLELSYLKRVEQNSGVLSVTRKYWFDCRMVAKAKETFPPFEVISKDAPLGPIAAKQALPPSPTGNGSVDAVYTVSTNEPRMAEEIGKRMSGFSAFGNCGVHLIGDGESVSFVMNDTKSPLVGSALYYAESMADQLILIARTVGG